MDKLKTVKTIYQNELRNGSAIQLTSHQEDGRRKSLGISFFLVLGSYAYGAILAIETPDPSNQEQVVNRGLSGRLARLPREGVITTGNEPFGETNIDVSVQKPEKGIPQSMLHEVIDQMEWSPQTIVFDKLKLIDRKVAQTT
jgi:hypothetical protein